MGKSTPSNQKKSDEQENMKDVSFPIIGIGASAGGLEALKAFFSAVFPDRGLAYLVVMHLSPDQPSVMDELLQKETEVPVSIAQDGEAVEPDHIYVTPPDRRLTIYKGKIQLLEPLPQNDHKPIDQFFCSLAQDQGKLAGAIILSGTGTDGSRGAKYIKEYEGIVIAQSEKTAGYFGMPGSVIGLSLSDRVLPPQEIPQELEKYFAHSKKIGEGSSDIELSDQEQWLNKILAVLRTQMDHDFYSYKKKTLLRRISRRMSLQHITSYSHYLRLLREDSNEIEALFRELLIGVTHFFRDAESFEAIKKEVLPLLFERLEEDEYLRVWIPACSTGEEAYSMAMIIRETLDFHNRRVNLQLFGTDIDERAIEKAREGLYPSSIVSDVGEERLRRFFKKEREFYRIRKEIRDVVVFSKQDILKDPPFSKLHILCCRNLLIYLESDSQKKLVPLFHYTLIPDGFLILGSSESIGCFSNLFEIIDKKWKIYRKIEVHPSARGQVEFPTGTGREESLQKYEKTDTTVKEADYGSLVRKLLLDRFSPAAVLIDEKGTMLYVQGKTGKFLETSTGIPSQDILNMAREGLRIELSAAIRKAASSGEPITRKKIAVRSYDENLVIPTTLQVYPLQEPKQLAGKLLLIFEESLQIPIESKKNVDAPDLEEPENRIAELERELQDTRESHQATTEELESANEELKSTNEELQSSNEELQSTNEELESSKEELQSLNEELKTVNAELQSKVEELSSAQDDLRNILNSTEIATLFVDNDMRIKRFTEESTTLFNLIYTDIGRPLEHVTNEIAYEHLIEDVDIVLKQLSKVERKIQNSEGHWYEMRILPYRTIDNRIDGAVLVFQDIDASEEAWGLVNSVFNLINDPMVVTDADGQIIIGNAYFSTLVGIDPAQLTDFNVFSLKSQIGELTKFRELIEIRNEVDTSEALVTEATMRLKEKDEVYSIRVHIIMRKNERPERFLLQFQKQEEQK